MGVPLLRDSWTSQDVCALSCAEFHTAGLQLGRKQHCAQVKPLAQLAHNVVGSIVLVKLRWQG